MAMPLRDRILAVYRGETPDVVPYMLDLSHWFYHKHKMPWDLSRTYDRPECELIDYHKQKGVGFYVAQLGSFYLGDHANGVSAVVEKRESGGKVEIVWRYSTPIGSIERKRIWDERTYSWHIADWAVKTEQDLRVLGYALGNRTYEANWDSYRAWVDYVGDTGVVYMPIGYSAMGHILCLWMGIEAAVYAIADWPETMREVVDQINLNTLDLVDLVAQSPAEVVVMGDNLSSDVQPPHFFRRWSRPFYEEAIRRLHVAGKCAAVHIDGRLRGALHMIREVGGDCGDALTPSPMGDMTPEECREEAGPDFILSGGIPPDLWLPNVDTGTFRKSVQDWLGLKRHSPNLILAAGDQVPPGAVEDRIEIARDMAEEHGRY
jgi:hypothetical protein